MTPIEFRVDPEGEVFALFPTIPGSPGCCTAYQHVGQHSSATYSLCIEMSRPATAKEFAPLLAELRQIGYNDLEVLA